MRLIISGDRKIPMKKNLMRVKANRVYKPKEVKDFETWLAWKAAAAMKEQGWRKTDQNVSLGLYITFGDKRKRDLQNCFASVCDALNNIVYVDDCQIVSLNGTKEYKKDEWSFSLEIEVHDEPSR
tara:strand:+ start:1508 stop:1882 length:375 start_codon:yes stop_codon:yes gene_type:complete